MFFPMVRPMSILYVEVRESSSDGLFMYQLLLSAACVLRLEAVGTLVGAEVASLWHH